MRKLRELTGGGSLEPAIMREDDIKAPNVRVWRAERTKPTPAATPYEPHDVDPADADAIYGWPVNRPTAKSPEESAEEAAKDLAIANAVYGWHDNGSAAKTPIQTKPVDAPRAVIAGDLTALRAAESAYLENLFDQTDSFLKNSEAQNPATPATTDENDPANWPTVFAWTLTQFQEGLKARAARMEDPSYVYNGADAATMHKNVEKSLGLILDRHLAITNKIAALPESPNKKQQLSTMTDIAMLLEGMMGTVANANLPLTSASLAAAQNAVNPAAVDPDRQVNPLMPRTPIAPEIFDAAIVKEAQPEVDYLKTLTAVTLRMVNELMQPRKGLWDLPWRNQQFAKSLAEDFLLPVQMRMKDIVARGAAYNAEEGKVFFEGRQKWLQERIKEFGQQQTAMNAHVGPMGRFGAEHRKDSAELENLKRVAGIIKGIRPETNTTGSKIGNMFRAAAKGLLQVSSAIGPTLAGVVVGIGMRAAFGAAALAVTASILPAVAAVVVASVVTGAAAGAATRGVSDGLRHLIIRNEAVRTGQEIPKFNLAASLARGARMGALGGGVASVMGLVADYADHAPPLFGHAAPANPVAALDPTSGGAGVHIAPDAPAAATAAATAPVTADPLAPLLAEVQQKVDGHFFDGLTENGMDVKAQIVQALHDRAADHTAAAPIKVLEWRLGGAAELLHNQAVLHHVANAESSSAKLAGLGHRIADAVGVNDKVADILRKDAEFFTRIGRGAELLAPTP